MEDNYRQQGLRRKLVNHIRKQGILDERLLEAFDKVPRHWFLDSAFLEHAYEDKPFPIGMGQTISQPYTVAFQTDLLEVLPGDKILEIGTGSGYQACILAVLGAEVFTIERHRKLYEKTTAFLQKNFPGLKIHAFYGDGYKGLPQYAPFDGVIITAGAPEIPQALIDQLKPMGKMVIPHGKGDLQTMKRIIKGDDGLLFTEEYGTFRFVPMLKNKEE